jgi:ABC-type antimicrobial peptide transport system permease subunit
VGVAPAGDSRIVQTAYRHATPEFFEVFGIPLLNGRHFTPAETQGSAALTIVSQTLARRLWGDGNAVGRTLAVVPDQRTTSFAPVAQSTVEVIGVARDIASGQMDSVGDRTQIYLPARLQSSGTVIVARVKGDVDVVRQQVDKALEAAAPGSIERIHSMETLAVGRVFPLRIAYWTSAVVGGVGMLLTISGVYGLLAFAVKQRSKEIGVRMALGADVRAIIALIVSHSLRLALVGLLSGTAIAAAASSLFGARLLRVTFDAAPVLAAAAIVFAACLCATLIPACRAARLDPVTTLRHD